MRRCMNDEELRRFIRLILKYHAENLAADFHTESEEDYILKKFKERMEDYKVRFVKEFKELDERMTKLDNMLSKYEEGTLGFTPASPISMFRAQYFAMAAYRSVLMGRAEIEDIDLTAEV